MEIFKFEESVIARIVRANEETESGLNFLSEENEILQVSFWNHTHGTELQPHIHNQLLRETLGTSEMVYVISGSVHLDLYNPQAILVHETTLKKGDLAILLSGGHGYKILEPDTKVLEVKNGPYFGQEADKSLIENMCSLSLRKD
jgi:hypothetical protein